MVAKRLSKNDSLVRFSISMPLELKEEIEKLAKEDMRTLNNYINLVMSKHIEYLKNNNN